MRLLVATITLLLAYLFTAHPTFAYSVKNGDTMSKIASENNLTLQELAEMNPHIQNPDQIYVGETLNIKEEQEPTRFLTITKHLYSEKMMIARFVRVEARTEDRREVITEMQNSYSDEIGHIEEPKKTISSLQIQRYSDDEIDLLARLVRAEAQIEPFTGKVAVACVVLNRIESPEFPNTIKAVIYERGQFQPVRNGEINKPADLESIKAVKAALTQHRDMVSKSLFFYNPTIATSRWLDSRTTTVVIGQHVFKN